MEEMTRVHPQDYVEAILSIQPGAGEHVHVDGDTVMGQGSAEAVRRAAGAVVASGNAWASERSSSRTQFRTALAISRTEPARVPPAVVHLPSRTMMR